MEGTYAIQVGGQHYGDVDCTALAEWLRDEAHALASRLQVIHQLSGYLRDDADLDIANVRESLETLSVLRKGKADAERILGDLGSLAGAVDSPVACDWSQQAELARWVLEFLGSHEGSPPNWLVRLLTCSEARMKAQHALAYVTETEFEAAWAMLHRGYFDTTREVSVGVVLEASPLTEVASWLQARAADATKGREWGTFQSATRDLETHGLRVLVDEVLRGKIRVEDAKYAFLRRFYQAWLDCVYQEEPCLRHFGSLEHEQLIQRFQDLDRESVKAGCERIRERLMRAPDRPRPYALVESPEESILRRVAGKARHQPSLRQLFTQIPSLLTTLKPCVMMSPLAVITYLESDRIKFDLVVFDEASQVRPYDAIGALYRGKQLLVAGDPQQLPPSMFFERLAREEILVGVEDDDDEDEQEDIADFESILDVCKTVRMARRQLRWHYRSRREQLIAFSNHHYYENRLLTFPSVRDANDRRAVSFEFVEGGTWTRKGSEGGANLVEARRAAQLAMEHFDHNPEQSLGIVAFSRGQQIAILDELERLRRRRPDMERFFQESPDQARARDSRDEPFFVKNLENVQGDERDVMLVSVGYGPNEHGTFAMRFGPLNQQGGERRLNVIVTRAREQVILVSSISSHDIDLSRTQARGVKLLKAYLDYAERGIESLQGEIRDDGNEAVDSPF
ncbi:MAG: DEAD/DEAH box helicase [Pirellulales bacterium]